MATRSEAADKRAEKSAEGTVGADAPEAVVWPRDLNAEPANADWGRDPAEVEGD